MANDNPTYSCPKCGSHGSQQGTCCGQTMQLMTENTTDASKEKHVPVIERVEGGIKVKVGSIPHPMEQKHFIQWIEIGVGEKVCRQYLSPGQTPEAFFPVTADQITVREYCNLHGLWKA